MVNFDEIKRRLQGAWSVLHAPTREEPPAAEPPAAEPPPEEEEEEEEEEKVASCGLAGPAFEQSRVCIYDTLQSWTARGERHTLFGQAGRDLTLSNVQMGGMAYWPFTVESITVELSADRPDTEARVRRGTVLELRVADRVMLGVPLPRGALDVSIPVLERQHFVVDLSFDGSVSRLITEAKVDPRAGWFQLVVSLHGIALRSMR